MAIVSKKDPQRQRLDEWRKLIAEIIDNDKNLRQALLLTDCNLVDQMAAGILSAPGPVGDAFKYFGLNPQNSSHCVLLLSALADLAFGRRKKGRRKNSKVWTTHSLFLLGCHYEVVIADHPGMRDRPAAEEIKRHFYTRRHISAETIRQRLPAARRELAFVRQCFDKKPAPVPSGAAAPAGWLAL